MNDDTSEMVNIHRVEQGMRTLTHDWRNVLNGINLRISSAQVADDAGEQRDDLAGAQQLIVAATQQMAALSRRLVAPSVTPIPYPTEYFLEDIAVVLNRETGEKANLLEWKNATVARKVLVDFIAISQAIGELIENTLRYHSADGGITISTREDDRFLVISWSEKIFGNPALENWGRVPFLTTERGHLGLGLYFANRVLLAHNGTLRFDFDEAQSTLKTTLRIPLEIV